MWVVNHLFTRKKWASLFEIMKLILLVSSMIITASLYWTRHCARLLYMLSYITFPMTYEAIISISQEQAVDLRSYLCKFKSLTSRREQSLKHQTRRLTVITSQGGGGPHFISYSCNNFILFCILKIAFYPFNYRECYKDNKDTRFSDTKYCLVYSPSE